MLYDYGNFMIIAREVRFASEMAGRPILAKSAGGPPSVDSTAQAISKRRITRAGQVIIDAVIGQSSANIGDAGAVFCPAEALAEVALAKFPSRTEPPSCHSTSAPSIPCNPSASLVPTIEGKILKVEHSFSTIASVELNCPEDYVVDGRNMLRHGDSIVFKAAEHGSVARDLIFYGPYSTLAPGVYLFAFSGQLDGELKVDFAYQKGTVVLKELAIDNFLDPVCLAITKTLTEFEVRGYKTPALNALKLDSISVETIGFPSA